MDWCWCNGCRGGRCYVIQFHFVHIRELGVICCSFCFERFTFKVDTGVDSGVHMRAGCWAYFQSCNVDVVVFRVVKTQVKIDFTWWKNRRRYR